MATFDPTKSNNLQEFAKFRGVMFFGLLCVHNIVWPTGGPQMCSKVWGKKKLLKNTYRIATQATSKPATKTIE